MFRDKFVDLFFFFSCEWKQPSREGAWCPE
jgi:hypothetical protein